MDYSQTNSIFQPGLTFRGPVQNSPGQGYAGLGALGLPILPPMVKYGLMAGLLYLGYKKKIPFGLPGGAVAAFAIWQFLPNAAPAAASGAPSAADIAASTAGASDIAPPDFASVTPPAVNMPAMSGLGITEFYRP